MNISSSAYMGVETLAQLAAQRGDTPCTAQILGGAIHNRLRVGHIVDRRD